MQATHSRVSVLAGVLTFTLLAEASAAKAQSDPMVGTWITDTLETKAVSTPYPWRSWRTAVERVPDGYNVRLDGVYRDGRKATHGIHLAARWGAVADYRRGRGTRSTYAWKRIDDHTFETARRGGDGHLTLTSRFAMSPDGKLRANCSTLWGRPRPGRSERSRGDVQTIIITDNARGLHNESTWEKNPRCQPRPAMRCLTNAEADKRSADLRSLWPRFLIDSLAA